MGRQDASRTRRDPTAPQGCGVSCPYPDLSPSWAYKQYRCRCERCRGWRSEKSRRDGNYERRYRTRRPDDGVVDWLIVDRLLSGEATLTDATYGEALEAARRGYGREGWWSWCEGALGLRSAAIRRIADEKRGRIGGAA